MGFDHVGTLQFDLPFVLPSTLTRDAKVSSCRPFLKAGCLIRTESTSPNGGDQMRKLILIAAITLASATANAGPSRSLSLAAAEPSSEPVAQQPTTTANTPAPGVARPKLAQEPEKAPVLADKPDETAKPKKKHVSTEARIIYELHRHGIYW